MEVYLRGEPYSLSFHIPAATLLGSGGGGWGAGGGWDPSDVAAMLCTTANTSLSSVAHFLTKSPAVCTVTNHVYSNGASTFTEINVTQNCML